MELELSPEEKAWIEESFIKATSTQQEIAALERAIMQRRAQVDQLLGEARGVFRTVLRSRRLNPDAFEAAWDQETQELKVRPLPGADVTEPSPALAVVDPA